MASDDKAAMAMATDDGADIHMATVTPTVLKMDDDRMPIEEASQSSSNPVSHGQIDANKDTGSMLYVGNPQEAIIARVQGMAKLREVLHDPNEKIADHIKKIHGFNKQLSSNNHCKKARQYLTGDPETPITDETVPFILAIWCMLGGIIPSMWRERLPGQKKGSKLPLSDWGKEMIEELDNLGTNNGYEFHHCQAYAAATESKTHYKWDEAAMYLNRKPEAEQAAKKSKRNAKPASLGKHGASSPRQSLASKRRTNVAIEMLQQRGRSFAGDDDTEDEGNQGEVGNEVMNVGSKQDVPASKATSTNVDSNRAGPQRPEVLRNGFRDQDDVSPPLQRTRPFPKAHFNQGLEGSFGNEAFRRRYGPGLNTSNMTSNKTFMGRESHGHNKGFTFEKPTAPGDTTAMLSPSYRNATASSGQYIFGMPFELQQDSTASPSRTPFEMSASITGGSAVPHVQLHSALEHPSGSGNANVMNDSHFGIADDDHFSPSQQISTPGRRQKTLQVTSPVNRGINTRDEDFATANREDSDRLDEAVSNRNISDAFSPGAQPEDPGQDNPDRTVLSTQFPAFIGHFEDSTKSAKQWYKDWMEQNEQNEKELSLLLRNDTAKDAKIAALDEEVNIWRAAGNEMEQLKRRITELEEVSKKSRRTADLLNRTSALTLLLRAGSMRKGLDTISLAEMLDEMDGNDGTGASEVEGF